MWTWIVHWFEKIFRVDEVATEKKKTTGEINKYEETHHHPEEIVEVVKNPYKIAMLEIGKIEFQGEKSNPEIERYYTATSLKKSDDSTPWCSAFVNWCFVQAKLEGTSSAMARSWLKVGNSILEDQAKEGDVVVYWRGSIKASTGHVGFVAGPITKDFVPTLGGNQSDAVNITKYPKSRVLGYRRFPYNK